VDFTIFLQRVRNLQGLVDALNITENQGARVRACSLAASALVIEHSEVEPILQVVCRGRNRLVLQSELLGAAALGVHNLLILSGDPPSIGDHPETPDYLDLDSVGLIAAAHRLCTEGRLISRSRLESRPSFFIGAACDPHAADRRRELSRLGSKVKAGARFLQTQPVFRPEKFLDWLREAEGVMGDAYLLVGILVLHGAGMARSISASLPEVEIAENLVRRLEQSSYPEREGMAMAIEIARALREHPAIRGFHLMMAGREDLAPRLLEKLLS
jgi:5,10-methylenetetrahydrofolate reductase